MTPETYAIICFVFSGITAGLALEESSGFALALCVCSFGFGLMIIGEKLAKAIKSKH